MTISRQLIIKEIQLIAFFAAASIGQTYFTCPSCNTVREYGQISFFSFIMWILLYKGNNYITHYLTGKISWFRFPVKRLIIGLISTIGYTLVAVIVAMIAFEKVFSFQFGKSFLWTIYFSISITVLISLVLHSREFLLRGRKATLDAEVLAKESIRAKYEALKSQVSPHFMFNSLNVLTNLVYEDQDKAAKFIKQLSEVYRYVLDTRDKEAVRLEDEMRFLNAYLFLQQIRFGDKLRLGIQLDGQRSMVAPLALQMLVENAIKHNVVSEEHPLRIRIYIDKGFIVVENDILRKSIALEESAGVGLDNIVKRYEFLSDVKVEVINTDKFMVKLPIIPEV